MIEAFDGNKAEFRRDWFNVAADYLNLGAGQLTGRRLSWGCRCGSGRDSRQR
jgi:hypothetical protein